MIQDKIDRLQAVGKAINDLRIYQHNSNSSLVTSQHYGYIQFHEHAFDAADRLPQFIRLSLHTKAETVVQFMQTGWSLPTPDLIISVTGGAKNFDMSARLRKIFQRGLVAAAITTNAWLITAGTNAGVVKEVGQALSNYRYKNRKQDIDIPCIGIASWGYTSHNDSLEQNTIIGKIKSQIMKESNRSSSILLNPKPTAISHENFGPHDFKRHVRTYVVRKRQEKRCDLEPNHSHFLLFDDETPIADNVLALRSDIEKLSRSVRQPAVGDSSTESIIPIVMVLVEGGPSSCRTICQALESNTPVVVVKDTGRAADLVADLYAVYGEGDTTVGSAFTNRPATSGQNRQGNREAQINAIFKKAKDKEKEKSEGDGFWADKIRDILCRVISEKKELITIFKFDSKRHHGNLEDAILEGLINAAKLPSSNDDESRRTAELRLAMAWNKIQYAKKHILTDQNISRWNDAQLHRALFDALRRSRSEFVELLIEYGASFEKLTYGDLKNLYNVTDQSRFLPIKKIGKSIRRTPELFYEDYFRSFRHYSNIKNEFPKYKENVEMGQTASRHLLFWSVFVDRFELSIYLCSKNLNPVVAALIGAHLYGRAARLALDPDVKKVYEGSSNKFDVHAMSIVDRCFDNDENFGVDLIKRKAVAFDEIDTLTLAQKANCRMFLASKCVQRLLDNTWYGNINYKRRAIEFRIFVCTIFFPLLPVFSLLLNYVPKHRQTKSYSSADHAAANQVVPTNIENHDFHRKEKNELTVTEKLSSFYAAPVVRFYYYTIFFVLFLGLFSFVMLVDYFPPNTDGGRRSGFGGLYIPVTEIILHICIWSLVLEETRQFFMSRWKQEYFAEIWNIIDLIAIVLYIIAFITRFFTVESVFTASKIFMCLDLIVWFVRTLHLFAAYEKLGPKLLMIFDTMKDLLFFVCFIIIFLMAFSITSWSLLTTNDQVTWNYREDGSLHNVTVAGGGSGLWSWSLLRTVTNYGIWKIFGQVDEIGNYNAYGAVAFVLAILFLAVANVLLLNLLVALFNLTIQKVQSESHRIWRYQRFLLVCEYNEKPPIPPPFNNFYYIYMFIKMIYTKCSEMRKETDEGISIDSFQLATNDNPVPKFMVTDPMQRESAIADDYWRSVLKEAKKDPLETTLYNMEQTLQMLKERMAKQNGGDLQVTSLED